MGGEGRGGGVLLNNLTGLTVDASLNEIKLVQKHTRNLVV